MRLQVHKVMMPDGCIVGLTGNIIEAATYIAKDCPKAIDRFRVNIDGGTFWAASPAGLKRILCDVSPGAECRLFRNSLQGATIDFETV